MSTVLEEKDIIQTIWTIIEPLGIPIEDKIAGDPTSPNDPFPSKITVETLHAMKNSLDLAATLQNLHKKMTPCTPYFLTAIEIINTILELNLLTSVSLNLVFSYLEVEVQSFTQLSPTILRIAVNKVEEYYNSYLSSNSTQPQTSKIGHPTTSSAPTLFQPQVAQTSGRIIDISVYDDLELSDWEEDVDFYINDSD